MNNDNFDLYDSEEQHLNAILEHAESEYESLKDRCHDLYDKLQTRGTITYIKKEDLNKWVAKYFKQDLISIDDLIDCIEELDDKVSNLSDELNDLKEDIEENYRRIPVSEQVE